MVGICKSCGKMFEASEEEANSPECACSKECLEQIRERFKGER
jgi:hypothetical protein